MVGDGMRRSAEGGRGRGGGVGGTREVRTREPCRAVRAACGETVGSGFVSQVNVLNARLETGAIARQRQFTARPLVTSTRDTDDAPPSLPPWCRSSRRCRPYPWCPS
jgi:hypothetical protein